MIYSEMWEWFKTRELNIIIKFLFIPSPPFPAFLVAMKLEGGGGSLWKGKMGGGWVDIEESWTLAADGVLDFTFKFELMR